ESNCIDELGPLRWCGVVPALQAVQRRDLERVPRQARRRAAWLRSARVHSWWRKGFRPARVHPPELINEGGAATDLPRDRPVAQPKSLRVGEVRPHGGALAELPARSLDSVAHSVRSVCAEPRFA